MKTIAIVAATAATLFFSIKSANADYWLYCSGDPVVCWQATPTPIAITIAPSPASLPATTPAACPGGAAPVNGLCPAVPSSFITTGDLNLRAGPGVNYAVVDTLPAGTPVMQSGAPQGAWLHVTVGSEQGWVNSSYLGAV